MRVAEDDRRWQVPLTKQALRTVQVGEDGVQQAGALDQSVFQHAPLVRIDQDRYEIEIPWPFRAAGRRIGRVRQAVLVQQPPGKPPALGEFAVRHAFQAVKEPHPARPDGPIGGDHLIVDTGQRLVRLMQAGGWEEVGRLAGDGHVG
jgi:hypothetical protein